MLDNYMDDNYQATMYAVSLFDGNKAHGRFYMNIKSPYMQSIFPTLPAEVREYIANTISQFEQVGLQDVHSAIFAAISAEMQARMDAAKQLGSEGGREMETGPEYLFNELTKADARIAELEADCARKDELLRLVRPLAEREMHYNTFTPEQQADAMDVLNRIDKEIRND